MMRLDTIKKRYRQSKSAVSFCEPEAHSSDTDPYMAVFVADKRSLVWVTFTYQPLASVASQQLVP